jgi:hypothetical protein
MWRSYQKQTPFASSASAQSLPFEQRKALIKALCEQLPKTAPLAGSIIQVGDLEAASLHMRKSVSHSLQRTAEQLRASEAES